VLVVPCPVPLTESCIAVQLMMDDATERAVDPVTESSSSAVAAPESPQPLSKNAIKKAAKAERYAAFKIERRVKEKEAKKEKKRAIAAKRAAGELDEDEEKRRQKKRPRIHFGGKVIVDLGFDDMMTEKVGCARLLSVPRHTTWI
jgi:tRNA (guanine9-N1)-methyltransferase